MVVWVLLVGGIVRCVLSPQKRSQVRTSTYLDPQTRERLDEFCRGTKRNVSGAIALFVSEGLDKHDAQTRSGTVAIHRGSVYQDLVRRAAVRGDG
jgi:hypothetical protein